MNASRFATRNSLAVYVAFSLIVINSARADESFPPKNVQQVLETYCIACHSGDEAEGNVRLDSLAKLNLDVRLTRLNKAQEQVFFGLMPPVNEDQPDRGERRQLIEWISSELRKHKASGLDEKLKRPEYGNYVDHDALFSGEHKHLPGYTSGRRWLISEHIFNAKINRLLDYVGVRTIDGHRKNVIGDNGVGLGTRFGGGTLRQSIVNPFLLPKTIGVRYFDNAELTRGQLLTMIANARKIAGHMTSEPTMKSHYPAMYRIMRLELAHRKTLRAREQFLDQFIPVVAEELYGAQNAELLPKFVRVDVEAPMVRWTRKASHGKKKPTSAYWTGMTPRICGRSILASACTNGTTRRSIR